MPKAYTQGERPGACTLWPMAPPNPNFDPNFDPNFEDADTDPEGPSPEDIARFDRDHQTCPSCASELYDDATICPICREIILAPTPSFARRYLWPLVGAALLIVILLTWVF